MERPLSPNFFFKAPSRNDEEYTSLPSLIEIFGTGQVKADQGKRYGNGIKSNGCNSETVRTNVRLI
jgi:hypothetical protein